MKFVVVLGAKEQHADKHEKSVLLKFDAPEREAQDALAGRDAFAHLQIKLTQGAADELVPVLERHHPKDVPHVKNEKGEAPKVGDASLPEIFVEGRRYFVTIEPAPAE